MSGAPAWDTARAMTDDETGRLLAEIAEQLRRIADGQEQLADRLDRASAERHRELMRALGDIVAQLDKIERTQYG